MALEIIGAGFGRTGTTSLRVALETLGFGPSYQGVNRRSDHLPLWERRAAGEPVDLTAVLAEYRSAVDWPVCSYWAELADQNPQAKVILTQRDPAVWYESMVRTLVAIVRAGLVSDDDEIRRRARFGNELIFEQTFGGRFDDRAHAIRVFEAHLVEVVASTESSRLLIFEASDGWSPLCEFLGESVPDTPFPHRNATGDFWRPRS